MPYATSADVAPTSTSPEKQAALAAQSAKYNMDVAEVCVLFVAARNCARPFSSVSSTTCVKKHVPPDGKSSSPHSKQYVQCMWRVLSVVVLQGLTELTDPFGDKLKLEEDHDAPHPDALSDRDYGQPCLVYVDSEREGLWAAMPCVRWQCVRAPAALYNGIGTARSIPHLSEKGVSA